MSEFSDPESVDTRADARALTYCETVQRTVHESPRAVTLGCYVTAPYTRGAYGVEFQLKNHDTGIGMGEFFFSHPRSLSLPLSWNLA